MKKWWNDEMMKWWNGEMMKSDLFFNIKKQNTLSVASRVAWTAASVPYLGWQSHDATGRSKGQIHQTRQYADWWFYKKL